jgi:hypothetical protein
LRGDHRVVPVMKPCLVGQDGDPSLPRRDPRPPAHTADRSAHPPATGDLPDDLRVGHALPRSNVASALANGTILPSWSQGSPCVTARSGC